MNCFEMIRDECKSAESIVVFSGAGLSAESGIPTYRDSEDPLWKAYDPEVYASRTGLLENPEMVVSQYHTWREQLEDIEPNAAHFAIANNPKVTHITQNVDDLSERAGKKAIHLHGELMEDRYDYEMEDLVRPSVVLFGEPLPADAWHEACDAIEKCDMLISVGTSLEVQPACTLVSGVGGTKFRVHIDPKPRKKQTGGVWIQGTACEMLPRLLGGEEWNA